MIPYVGGISVYRTISLFFRSMKKMIIQLLQCYNIWNLYHDKNISFIMTFQDNIKDKFLITLRRVCLSHDETAMLLQSSNTARLVLNFKLLPVMDCPCGDQIQN